MPRCCKIIKSSLRGAWGMHSASDVCQGDGKSEVVEIFGLLVYSRASPFCQNLTLSMSNRFKFNTSDIKFGILSL